VSDAVKNVNSPVRRIECEHVLSIRRREDLKRNAGCGYKVKVRRSGSSGVSGLRVARGDTEIEVPGTSAPAT